MTDPAARLKAALADRYRIERQLGEGGMATVYLADDLKHGRKVAIKVLRPELAAIVGAERFLAEIRTTANLQHPHILPLFDSGEADGFLFYVMPFIDGESLREQLDREKQLPMDEAVGIAVKVASALQAAHASGVIHRDIKPANILLANGEPLIADFGIALALQEAGGGRLTETGLSVGTPFYMSPEQATADRAVSPATDIYALGCVLYEMLVGEPPYVGNSAQAVLGKILTDTPKRPTSVRPRIRPNVEAAVMRALEKLPADRFASAGEFLRALEDPAFRHGDQASARAGTLERGSRLWPGIAAVLAVACMGLGVAHLLPGDIPEAPTVRFRIPLPAGLETDLGSGVGLDVSPAGNAVVFRAGARAVEVPLWLHRLDRLEPEVIDGTEGALNPRFSPRGDAIVYLQDGAVRRTGVDGSPAVTLVPSGVRQAGLAWGEDGFIYFLRDDGTGLHRVPAEGGVVEPVAGTEDAPRGWAWPDVLPGGRGVIVNVNYGGPADDSIVVHDLETGEGRTLFQGAMARWSSSGHLLYTAGEGTVMALPFDPDRLEPLGAPFPLVEGVRVNTGSATQFAVSRSGTLVYGAGEALSGGLLYWLGGEGREVVPGYGEPKPSESYAVSPDGGKIAMSILSTSQTGPDIWVLDLEDGVFSRITFDSSNFLPFWHPDSDLVGFLREGTSGDGPGLYVRPLDLSEEARLLWTVDDYPDQAPLIGAWTPDGSRLAVSLGFDSLVTVAAHPDSVATPLFSPPGLMLHFEISPNGDWIAYDSDESGRWEVYVRPFPGPGGQRQVSSGGGRSPRWLPSGDGLVYTDPTGEVFTLARFESERDPRRIATETLLDLAQEPAINPVDARDWDLGADGRILVSGVERGRQGPPVVVLNWFAEWVERDGRGR